MDETPMNETVELIAGFPKAAWEKFLQPIPGELVKKDPNKMDYVKHQICTEMLNECFGQDGWQQEVVETWQKDEYPYKGGEKTGRAYAEALIRLTIIKPGSGASPAVRENIGSQVAGGDWSETRKGAVSEGLKRAASLFGWAANVYKTEAFGEWEQLNGNAQTQTSSAGETGNQFDDSITVPTHRPSRLEKAPEEQSVIDIVTFRAAVVAIVGTDRQAQTLAIAKAKVDLNFPADVIPKDMETPELRKLYARILINEQSAAQPTGQAA